MERRKERKMSEGKQGLEAVREHCREVGKGIEKLVADGGDLLAAFEGTQCVTFRVVKDGQETRVVGGTLGGDDSHLVISEAGVCKVWMDEVVGYAFDGETRAAMVDLFTTLYSA